VKSRTPIGPGLARWVAALGVALWALGPVLALPVKSERWIRVDTPHFVLFGNAGKHRVSEIGRNLEQLRDTLTRTTKGMSVHSPLPTYIFVFRNEASFAPYKLDPSGRPRDLAGYFVAGSDANYVAVDASAGESPFTVIYHEYLHDFMNNNLPDLPRWLDEGFAEFYSTFRVRGGKAELGLQIPRHLVTLRSGSMLRLDELFAVTVESDDYHGERAGTFYAQSWALTHYLMVGSERGRTGINAYVNRIGQGDDPITAFPEAFGMDLEQARQALREYVGRERIGYLVFELDDPLESSKPVTAPLERRQVVYLLGELLSHTLPIRYDDAEEHYREALRLDESHAPSYVGLARLEDFRGRYNEAIPLYDKAIAADPGYAPAYRHYGRSLLGSHIAATGGVLEESPSTTPVVARSRELFRKCLELEPDDANARAGLGKTYLFGAGDVEPGIVALTAASRELPSRTDILYDLLVLQVRAGNRTAARSILNNALRYRADDELVAQSERIVLSLDLEQADTLLAEGRVEEAVAVLERVAAETTDPELAAQIRAEVRAAVSFADERSQIELYNLAMGMINEGDYETALAILEQLVPQVEDPELAARGQAHIVELREVTRHNRLVLRYNRAVREANAGRTDAATRLLEGVLAEGAEGDLREKAESMLGQLREQR
jgi:tetratricopeptide (TPR) repeat protein